MKKYYYAACLLSFWLAFAVSAHAQSSDSPSKTKTVSDVENRTAYFGLASDKANDGHGLSTFNSSSPDKIKLLKKWDTNRFIYAGAGANGEYYAFFYIYDNSGENMSDTFSKINLSTGEEKVIKDCNDFKGRLQDMTYDYSTNTMYAVGFFPGGSSLYTIDLKTGELKNGPGFFTNMGPHILCMLAATYDGRLYGMDGNAVLYEVDKETGALTFVMETGNTTGTFQSLEFDHTDEALYWVSSSMSISERSDLYKIDVEKKTCKSVGQLGGGDDTSGTGLYIPFVMGGFEVPGAAVGAKVTPESNGGNGATISWVNPTKTHGGDELIGDLNIVLERDGNVIGNTLGSPGEEMLWEDKSVEKGLYVYTVKISNAHGEGIHNNIEAYVGPDVPGSVKDLVLTAGENCKSIKLKWSVPEKGAHNGYYDKSNVKFKIVRYPDKAVIIEDFEGTSYEDKTMKRLGAYYYGITAINLAGSNEEYASKNNTVVAGKEENIPYYCGFENSAEVESKWTLVDGNKDGYEFMISLGWGNMFFGDVSFSADYVMPNDGIADADDWLISPPMNFDKDKKYYVSFDTRSWGVDEFTVTVGKLNNVESQKDYVANGVFTVDASEDENKSFMSHAFQLPILDGIHCVGINLVTAYRESQLFQINNFQVLEGVAESIESVSSEMNVKVVLNEGRLAIEGDFNAAEIYTISGMKIASLDKENAQMTTTDWQPGIYIVKVTNADSVYTQKVMVNK